MFELFQQLGIDWRLLLAQMANFLVVLAVLTWFVFKPLLRLLNERKKKIESGLRNAEEMDRKIFEIDTLKSEKLAEAEKSALAVIVSAELAGKKKTQEIIEIAKGRAENILTEAVVISEKKKVEEMNRFWQEAKFLVTEAVAKTVELDPEKIDERLVERAVEVLRK